MLFNDLFENNFKEKAFNWNELSNELSVDQKILIAENYFTNNKLLESEDHAVTYFNDLKSDPLKKNQKYIVVPLLLIQNTVHKLNTDLVYLKFINKTANEVIFVNSKGETKKYPETKTEKGIYKTFAFDNKSSYNDFRSKLQIKFNIELPPTDLISEGREPYSKAIDKLEVAHINALNAKMDEIISRVNREKLTPEHKQALKKEYIKLKAERDSIYGIKDGTPEFTVECDEEGNASVIDRIGQAIKQFTAQKYGSTAFDSATAYAGSTFRNANINDIAGWGNAAARKTGPVRLRPVVKQKPQNVEVMVSEWRNTAPGADEEQKKLKKVGIVRRTAQVDEMDKSAEQPGRDGHVSNKTYGSRDNDKSSGKESQGKPTTAKQAAKDALATLNKLELAESASDAKNIILKVMSQVHVDGGGGNLSYMLELHAPTLTALRDKYHDDLDAMFARASKEELAQAAQELRAIMGQVEEGFVPLDKYSPTAVCLAGKPVKKFDYYKDAENFYKNWKQKLYREGNTEKADKITLMPLNLDETKQRLDPKCWDGYKKQGTKMKDGVRVNNCVPKESVEEDWQKANKKDKTDGMSSKAVKSYRREHPGSKLQTAVTTKPSKLKKGSKDSKRRSSYCARSKGQKDMHNIDCTKTPDKAICKARKRWNCEESVHEGSMADASHHASGAKFGGYYKGTQVGAPKPGQSFGAESVEHENPMNDKELAYLIAKAKGMKTQPDPALHKGDDHEIDSDRDFVEAISKKDLLNKLTKDLNSDEFKNTPVDPNRKGWTGPKPGDQNYTKNFGHGYPDTPSNRSHDRYVKKSLKKDVDEGAKVDRMVQHIAKSEKSAGKSKKDAESIAWATANKRGYLDNANKKKHTNEGMNFMEWAVSQGSRFNNFAGNPEIYAQAKQAFFEDIYGGIPKISKVPTGAMVSNAKLPTLKTNLRKAKEKQVRTQKALSRSLTEVDEAKAELQPGQYYVWTVHFDDGTQSKCKVTSDQFDPKAYYAKKNKVVIKTDYDWTIHG